MFVSGFCVETLETLCLTADLGLSLWKRFAYQLFFVETLESLCLSAGFVLRLWKRCPCQRISC